MSGDYLWDRSGPRDPDLVTLERVLGALGQSAPPPPLKMPRGSSPRPVIVIGVIATFASVAAALALVAFVWLARHPQDAGLTVTRVDGTPMIGTRAVTTARELSVGRWLETNDAARATIDIGDIGRVDVDPGTRLGLISTKPGNYRLSLARGTLHARIWSPPGQFFVETTSSTVVDLGCAYSMDVGDDGVGIVRVETGWVGFEWQGRESFIPAGAMCVTRPGLGPGTPHYEDTSAAFQSAIDVIDGGDRSAEARRAALDVVLTEARAKDVVTLWHLLARVDTDARARVFDRLAQFVPPPAGVTREGICVGGQEAAPMRDDWWDALGLGTASWWRTWKQQWK